MINKINKSADTIDVKSFFKKFTSRWYYFVLSLVFFLGLAYLKVRYTKPVFSIGSSLLINHEDMASQGISELDMFIGGKGNIDNEIGLLKAYSLTEKVVKSLPFNVEYFLEGSVQENELYDHSPIVVEFDSLHAQALGVPIYVKILSKDKYQIEVDVESLGALYDFNKCEPVSYSNQPISIKKELNFGEQFVHKSMSFKIYLRDTSKMIGNGNKALYFRFRSYENIINEYLNKIDVTKVSKTGTIVNVNTTGSVVRKEIDFLNRFNEIYLNEGLKVKNEIASRTIDFIDKQLSGISDSLFINENSLEEFRTLNKTFDVSESSKRLSESLELLENEKAMLQVQIQYYLYLKNYLLSKSPLKKEDIIAPSSIDIEDPLLTKMISDLVTLLEERNKLSLSTLEGNPYVKALNSNIETVAKTLIENMDNILASAYIKMKSYDSRIAKIDEELNRLPAKERKLINIQRKYLINDKIYTFLLEKKAEAAISKASNTADNRVVDKARLLSGSPLTPKINVIYSTAFLLGLILPMVIIIIITFMNDKILTREELEAVVSMPVLGGINHFSHGNKIAVLEKPKSVTAEMFRTIRINLEYFATSNSTKVIALTSSISGEGKTFCSINIASVIAITGKKTIIIGADLRRPRLGEFFDKKETDRGLTNYLSGKSSIKDIIQKTGQDNLDMILSGSIPPNPAELLGHNNMEVLMEYLRQNYDYVIIDTPPLMLVADFLVIQKYVDISIYIVRQNYSIKKLLEKVQDLYEDGRLPNMCVVLNDVKVQGGYGYGYEYGYNYGYGNYYDDEKILPKGIVGRIYSSLLNFFQRK